MRLPNLPQHSRRCLYIALFLAGMILVTGSVAIYQARIIVFYQLENEADMLAYRIGELIALQAHNDNWMDDVTPLLLRSRFRAVSIKTPRGEITLGEYNSQMQASLRHVQTAEDVSLSLWSESLDRLAMQKQLEYAAATILILFAGFMVYRDGQQRLLHGAASNHDEPLAGYHTPNHQDLLRRLSDQQTTISQLQQQLTRIGNECEELQTARTSMLASFSLELRTQLNAIIGYTELLLEDNAPLNNASLQDLQNILFASKHLLNLINDVTDLVKIESGALQLKPEYFSVKAVINDIANQLQTSMQHQHNTFKLNMGDNVGQIFTDRTQFARVLGNMLRNACIYTSHGEIRMTVNREKLHEVDYIKIELDDTGMGVPQDNINKLFKEFSYAEQSKFDGIGYDLAISRRLCHILGGDIAITSNQQKGSSFIITLAAMMNQQIDEDSDDY